MLDGFVPFPEAEARRYRDAGLWEGRALGWYVDDWARRYGAKEALSDGSTRLTYEDLAQMSTVLAHHLRDLGINPRDRVLVQLPNVIEFVILLFALLKADVIPVLALPAHREFEVMKLIEHAQAVGYVFSAGSPEFDYADMASRIVKEHPGVRYLLTDHASERGSLATVAIDELLARAGHPKPPLAQPDAADVAILLLSGGTTGVPKIIPRTHNDYAYNFRQSGLVSQFTDKTVYLTALSMAHNFPLGSPGILATFSHGGRVVVAADAKPETVFPLMVQEGVTVTAVVPAIAIRWAESDQVPSPDVLTLQLMQVGGSRLAPEAARRVRQRFRCQLQQAFGMAEGLINLTSPQDPDPVIDETQGRPMSPFDEVVIADAFDRPVPPGQSGHLLTRGPYTIRGYYRADAVNQESFTQDGYYRTGDIVHWDASGNLVVDGRAKDLINRGGEKISAEEVENLLLAHPSVLECAVVAMPDAVLGERACAFVIPREGVEVTLEAVTGHLAERGVAKYKWPERLEVMDQWPLTAVGKINKQVLRQRLQNGSREATDIAGQQ